MSASKQNYPHYQKMCYGMHFTAKKLKPYFQEHPITVVCTAALAEIIGSRDASGRLAKWAIDLAPDTIYYQPRTAIKSQALANFLVDWARPSTCRQRRTPPIGGCTLMVPRCIPVWEPASSSPLPKATSSDMCCKSILPPVGVKTGGSRVGGPKLCV